MQNDFLRVGRWAATVHDENHYSLFVIVNCGAVCAHIRRLIEERALGAEERDSPFPCLLHFDSMRGYHDSEGVARCIRQWLNSEWMSCYPGGDDEMIFTKKNMQLHKPAVPQQPDGYHCGFYVCRFMYNMFRMRHHTFSYKEAGVLGSSGKLDGCRAERGVFVSLLTDNDLFQFGVQDIKVIRRNLALLILRLGCQYKSILMEQADARMKRSKPCED